MECLFDIFKEVVQRSKDLNPMPFVRDLITKKWSYKNDYFVSKQRKVLILGSGGLSIGQAGEFDYSGAQVINS